MLSFVAVIVNRCWVILICHCCGLFVINFYGALLEGSNWTPSTELTFIGFSFYIHPITLKFAPRSGSSSSSLPSTQQGLSFTPKSDEPDSTWLSNPCIHITFSFYSWETGVPFFLFFLYLFFFLYLTSLPTMLLITWLIYAPTSWQDILINNFITVVVRSRIINRLSFLLFYSQDTWPEQILLQVE